MVLECLGITGSGLDEINSKGIAHMAYEFRLLETGFHRAAFNMALMKRCCARSRKAEACQLSVSTAGPLPQYPSGIFKVCTRRLTPPHAKLPASMSCEESLAAEPYFIIMK
jgi:hypothetical protein